MSNLIALVVVPQNPTTPAGSITTARLTVRNQTLSPLNLVLEGEGEQAGWLAFEPADIRVLPDSEADVTLDLAPPADCKPAAYLITVLALESQSSLEAARLAFALTVQPPAAPILAPAAPAAAASAVAAAAAPTPFPALLLSVNLVSQTSANSADYRVQVGNPTATLDSVDLRAFDETNRLSLVMDPPQVMIPAQGQGQALLHVTANTPLAKDQTEATIPFQVQAESTAGAERARAQATFVQTQPPAPAGGIMSNLPLLLAGAGIVVLLLAILAMFANQANQNQGLGTPVPAGATAVPRKTRPTGAPVVITQPAPVVATGAAPGVTALPPTAIIVTPAAVTAIPPGAVTGVAPTRVPPAAAATAAQGSFAVTSVVAQVSPATGTVCPQEFRFTANISASGPGTLQYQWKFSTGQTLPPTQMVFRAAGTQTAQTSVQVSQSMSGWAQLQVLAPPSAPSNQAAFTLTCP